MKLLFNSIFFGISLMLYSCAPTPVPIALGTDLCDHCKMTIVDHPFAAELVTDKGKVFKFDAIECMVQYSAEKKETVFPLKLVMDFNNPGEWIDAMKSYYLISRNLPSPMGAYLSAYKNQESAQKMLDIKEGEVFDWNGLNARLIK